MHTFLQVSNFSSNLFLTAAAQNLLCLDLAAQAGVAVSSPWLTWFIAAAPPCIVGMILCPLAVFAVCPLRPTERWCQNGVGYVTTKSVGASLLRSSAAPLTSPLQLLFVQVHPHSSLHARSIVIPPRPLQSLQSLQSGGGEMGGMSKWECPCLQKNQSTRTVSVGSPLQMADRDCAFKTELRP
jgi:hypothetical protein